jgi:uncharacterized protein YukJ
MNLADLSKDTLIEITRIVNDGTVGDTGRNAKQFYVDLLAKKDATQVAAAYAQLGPSAECAEGVKSTDKAEALAAALRDMLQLPQAPTVKREDVEKIVAEYLEREADKNPETTEEFVTRLVQEQMAVAFKHVAAYIELGIKKPEAKS